MIVLVGGCVTTAGNQEITEISRYRNIEEGVSTKINIYEEFGQPANVEKSALNETIWTYYYAVMTQSAKNWIPYYGFIDGGVNQDISSTIFIFDTEDILTELHTSEKRAQQRFLEMWQVVGGGTDRSYFENVKTEMLEMGLPFDEKKALMLNGIAEAD